MRNLLFALLLANFAMLAFRYWVVEPPRGESLQPLDVPRLELAQSGERGAGRAFPTQQQPAEVSPDAAEDALDDLPPQQTAARAPLRCLAVGPFSELRASDLAALALREQGFNPVRQAEEGQVWVGYWLLLEVPAEASVTQPVREGGARDAAIEERDCPAG